jgi:HEAT repeat protein
MSRVVMGAVAALLLGGGMALASSSSATQLIVNDEPRHRGADSARVAQFLDAVAAADPVLCELVSDQLGNFWFSGDASGIGRLADARATAFAAKDSVTRRVTQPNAIRLLASELDAENPCSRLVAAKMLGNSTAADAEFERLLESNSPRVREATLRALAVRERPMLRRAVERQLASNNAEVAVMAVYALGHLEDRAAVPRLREELKSPRAQMRMTAAWALGMIEDPAAAADLEPLARADADRRVRLVAIGALGDIEASRSFETLVALLAERDLELATAAAEALSSLDTPSNAPAALLKAAQSEHRPLRLAALEALAHIEDPAVIPLLLANITDADPDVRTHMIEALGELKAANAVAALRAALNDPVAEVRRAAVEALAEIADQ